MPPKTAIRVASGIALLAGSVGAERSILVTGVASVVTQRIRPHGLGKCAPQAGVGCFQKDGADVDPAITDEPAVGADQLTLVVAHHHLGRDALLRMVAAAAPDLGTDPQCRQDLEPRAIVA